MTGQNAFLAFADRSMSRPVRAQVRAAQKRQMHRAQKEAVIKALNERDLLLRLWKKWRREILNDALKDEHQDDIEVLIDTLNNITLKTEKQILDFMRIGAWTDKPKDIQFLALRLIDARLAALREKKGLPPFNDALWGEPLTVFQQIRNMFLCPEGMK